MATITTDDKYIIIDGTSMPKNSFTVSKIKDGVRINGPLTGVIEINISGTTIDGVQVSSRNELHDLLNQHSFNIGGALGGIGGQSETHLGTTMLNETQLNEMYPDALTVVAPNTGSGIIYRKIVTDEESKWYSWGVSPAN